MRVQFNVSLDAKTARLVARAAEEAGEKRTAFAKRLLVAGASAFLETLKARSGDEERDD